MIDKDINIMNPESDLVHGGNLDNEPVTHPPNLANIFDDDVGNLLWETFAIDGDEGEITEHSHDREETNRPKPSSLTSARSCWVHTANIASGSLPENKAEDSYSESLHQEHASTEGRGNMRGLSSQACSSRYV